MNSDFKELFAVFNAHMPNDRSGRDHALTKAQP